MKPEHRLFYHKDNFPLLSRFQGNFFKPFQLFYKAIRRQVAVSGGRALVPISTVAWKRLPA